MIQDKIFFDEKDPTGLSYNTPFTFYGSYEGRLWSKAPGGEIKFYTQNSDLSVFATTGSNQFNGSQTVTGSLTVTEGITGTVSSASYVEYTNVANKPALVSGSAQIADFGIFATTGSNGFNGSQSITGSLTVTGQVVAQTLNVQQVTSSVVYSSGSNIFGNELSNTQQFTGSVSITGSLNTSIAAFGSAATVFLTSDGGVIKSRTAAQTLSDIAALPLAGGTLTGALNGTSASFSGAVGINDDIGNALTYGRFSAGIPIAYLRASAGSTGGFRLTNHNGADVIVVNGANAITLDAPTTITGAATFSSSVTAQGFNTSIGTVSAATSTWVTVYTIPQEQANEGVYNVYAHYNDNDGGMAFTQVLADRTHLREANKSNGTAVTIQLSGRNIQVQQIYGTTVDIQWSILWQKLR